MQADLDLFDQILDNIGVYVEYKDNNLKISEIIGDSLTYISFFLEVEKVYDIEIPDEFYTDDIYEFTITEFIEKIVIPLKES